MQQTKIFNQDRNRPGEKTEAILEGAMQEFLTNGYAATSMDRVAAAAGVSKTTVYSYFQDKEGLFNALIEKLAKEKFQAVMGIDNGRVFEGEPSVVLRRLATNMLSNICNDQQHLAFIRLIMGESGRFPELAKAFVRNLAKTGIDVVTQYLVSCPELQLQDPEATARIFIGTLVYFIQVQEMMHGKEIIPMESDRLIDSLIYLIVNKQSEQIMRN
jgi:TetR/AcrR family transcriptional regulator, regulator of autoinduction and epiphytic fitness